MQLLPSVRDAHESDRSGEPRRGGCQRECKAVTFGEQHGRALVVAHPCGIAVASVGEMGSEQGIQAEVCECAVQRDEANALEDDVAPGIGQYLPFDAVPAVEGLIADSIGRNTGCHAGSGGAGMALFFREIAVISGDEEAKIAGARVVDARTVNLVQNAMTQGEPDATVAADGCAQTAFRARRPSAGNARPAGRKYFSSVSRPRRLFQLSSGASARVGCCARGWPQQPDAACSCAA